MSAIRTFETGATRDTNENKLDFEGFNNPLVDESFAEYMHKHRVQSDGSVRDGDNWQKGMPRTEYIRSMFRHFHDLRKLHRGYAAVDRTTGKPITILDALNAIKFNVNGYVLEELKDAQGHGAELEDDGGRCDCADRPWLEGVRESFDSQRRSDPGCNCRCGRAFVRQGCRQVG